MEARSPASRGILGGMDYLFAPERHEADGFVLRCYDVGDGPLLADAANESYEHLRPWMPWAKPDNSVEEAEQRVREFRARYLLAENFVSASSVPTAGDCLEAQASICAKARCRAVAPRWACSSARVKRGRGSARACWSS